MSEALTPEAKKLLPGLIKLSAGYYLAGGTALALQIGHRVSVDFDFFSDQATPADFLERLEETFFKERIKPAVNNPEELTAVIDGVQVTFLKYPFPVLGELVEHDGLQLLNIPEIGAAKAYSLGRRATYKDYVDLYFILAEKHAGLDEILELAKKKYEEQFNQRLFLEQLVYLRDVRDLEIEFLKEPVDKDEVENFFQQKIKTLKF